MSITSERIREQPFFHVLADDAAEDIEGLEREIDQLRAENERLKAELAEAKKDAEQREDLQDVVSEALGKAWKLGQTYWQQADSESLSQQKKADHTYANFQYLVDDTIDTIEAMKGKH